MKLIGSLPSPFVRKIRILLAEKGLPYEFVLEDVWGDNHIPEYNPLIQIPCLILDDSYALFDSRVIEDYLEDLVTMHIPTGVYEKLAVKKWAALADGIIDAALKIRADTVLRPIEKSHQPWLDRQTSKIMQGLDFMESHLTHHLWCANNSYSLADVATVSMLGYLDFRMSQLAWRESHPHLAKLANYLNELEPFKSTLPQ